MKTQIESGSMANVLEIDGETYLHPIGIRVSTGEDGYEETEAIDIRNIEGKLHHMYVETEETPNRCRELDIEVALSPESNPEKIYSLFIRFHKGQYYIWFENVKYRGNK